MFSFHLSTFHNQSGPTFTRLFHLIIFSRKYPNVYWCTQCKHFCHKCRFWRLLPWWQTLTVRHHSGPPHAREPAALPEEATCCQNTSTIRRLESPCSQVGKLRPVTPSSEGRGWSRCGGRLVSQRAVTSQEDVGAMCACGALPNLVLEGGTDFKCPAMREPNQIMLAASSLIVN